MRILGAIPEFTAASRSSLSIMALRHSSSLPSTFLESWRERARRCPSLCALGSPPINRSMRSLNAGKQRRGRERAADLSMAGAIGTIEAVIACCEVPLTIVEPAQ